MSNNSKDSKDLFFTEKIGRIVNELKSFNKSERSQFRVDAKALMCRGIEDNEVKRIQYGLHAENGMFYLSRLYVPYSLFSLYRRGVFEEHFTFAELKHLIKIVIVM